jgi:hypothetical protein
MSPESLSDHEPHTGDEQAHDDDAADEKRKAC